MENSGAVRAAIPKAFAVDLVALSARGAPPPYLRAVWFVGGRELPGYLLCTWQGGRWAQSRHRKLSCGKRKSRYQLF